MNDAFAQDIAEKAAWLVELARCRVGDAPLDYSEASLATVEAMAADTVEWVDRIQPKVVEDLARGMGCYLLEVGLRAFGGRYLWHAERAQPVLVVGEPSFRVSMITWDKVRGRLGGDAADNLPFFYAGFAERVREARPGDSVLFV